MTWLSVTELICVTYDHGYVPCIVDTISSLYYSFLCHDLSPKFLFHVVMSGTIFDSSLLQFVFRRFVFVFIYVYWCPTTLCILHDFLIRWYSKNGTGIPHPSGAPELTPVFNLVGVAQSLVFSSTFCRYSFVSCPLFSGRCSVVCPPNY
jgi:hypothetical protein